jgi:hypothetical protein
MRTLWLASTAFLITTGIACAQSAPTSAPAPTGAISAPQVSPSGVAPGNMAPAQSSGSLAKVTTTVPANSSASPAPNGAASAPDVNSGATPGTAPGKMSTASNGAASNGMDQTSPGPMYSHHHHWSSTGGLPEDASATTYLHIAKSAIWHHNVTLADDALSHAETYLLNRSVPQGQIAADDSPSIQSIESARKALHAGDYTQASADTKQAASAVSGM